MFEQISKKVFCDTNLKNNINLVLMYRFIQEKVRRNIVGLKDLILRSLYEQETY